MALANMTQEETNQENRNHCKHIAEELEKYVDGEMYRCPECGEIFDLYQDGNYETADEADDEIEKATCPHCGYVSEHCNNFEQLNLWDWTEDVLDIEYRMNSQRELRSVQIMVACGGPNIYVDTATKSVELYWWGDRASYPISYDAAAELDAWAEEMWGC